MSTRNAFAAATAAAALLTLSGPNTQAQEMELSELPEAVQAAIAANLTDGTVREIEIENEGGQEIYEVEIVRHGAVEELQITAAGEILGAESEGAEEEEEEGEQRIPLADAPEAVQAAIAAAAGDVAISEITREEEDGTVVFEAEWTAGGVQNSVEVSEAGDLLERERSVAAEALPAAVIDQIHAQFPGAQIDEAEAVEIHLYEVEIEHASGEAELTISPTGRIHGQEHEDEHGHP